ncbi:hypothetical protein FH972_012229 [Carpinus fangiana]|uniref:LysM domain-containing protein n=1 Tax=Carpinus fangiana TaxID=176857 RepID=A0A5N6R363_9ROSI|nr:hypothetical protein FH972_012229 [Carpinus fangiana]
MAASLGRVLVEEKSTGVARSGQAWRDGGDDPTLLVPGTNLSIHLPCGCVEIDSQTVVTYTVQEQDTLSRIAALLSAQQSDIQRLNTPLLQNQTFYRRGLGVVFAHGDGGELLGLGLIWVEQESLEVVVRMTLLLEAVSWSWREARLMSFQTSSMALVVLEMRSPRQEVENGEAEEIIGKERI